MAIDGDNEGEKTAVLPSPTTINDGSYEPLSRPIFIYVRKDALDRPEVETFVKFYINNSAQLATEVGYIPLPDVVYQRALDRVLNRESGTAYSDDNDIRAVNLLSK